VDQLPTICYACGYIFLRGATTGEAPAIIIANSYVRIATQGECPRCHGGGSSWQANLPVDAAVRELLKHGTSPLELAPLISAVSSSIKNQATTDETAVLIEARAPKYAGLSTLLPHGRIELYAFLGFVATFLQLVVSLHPLHGTTTGDPHSVVMNSPSDQAWQYY
jgi:hypothetical protein